MANTRALIGAADADAVLTSNAHEHLAAKRCFNMKKLPRFIREMS